MTRRMVCLGWMACTLVAAGCGGVPDRYPAPPASNATVVKVVAAWVPDAPANTTAEASAPRSSGTATPSADARKGTAADSRRTRTRPPAPGRASESAAGGRAVAATGTGAARKPAAPVVVPQFRYVLELDSGTSKTLDFGVDQKLQVGDRVLITESGALQAR